MKSVMTRHCYWPDAPSALTGIGLQNREDYVEKNTEVIRVNDSIRSLLSYESTLRGKPLPRPLGALKYWIDHWRTAFSSFLKVVRALRLYSGRRIDRQDLPHYITDLYSRTWGVSNVIFHKILTRKSRGYSFPEIKGPETMGLVADSTSDIATAVKHLRRDGYYVFPKKLPDELIQSLCQYFEKDPVVPWNDPTGKPVLPEVGAKELKCAAYLHSDPEALKCPGMQYLISDTTIMQVAQEYLGCLPILDIAAAWWTFPLDGKSDPRVPQEFHFDMDRFRWLKFFIYLNDVSTDNGPHCFIRGTHRPFSQPWELTRHGYHRHSDATMKTFYKAEDFIEVLGARGTIIAEDTRGFHKGKPAKKGYRLMAELQYSGHLFGAFAPDWKIPQEKIPELRRAQELYPKVFSRFS
jgi:hypothetical protein